MTIKRILPLTVVIATTLSLTACGGDDKLNGKFSSTTEIRDALAGTDYGCVRWDDYEEVGAQCSFDEYVNTPNHWVKRTDRPDMFAAVTMDNDPENIGSVIGDDWVLDCDTDLTAEQCGEVASILGEEYVYRGYWS